MSLSCVLSTPLDESGAVLEASDLDFLYQNDRVLGLAELMDFHDTVRGDNRILIKSKVLSNTESLSTGMRRSCQEKRSSLTPLQASVRITNARLRKKPEKPVPRPMADDS